MNTYLQAIHNFRLIDDTFMSVVFQDNTELTEFILRIILSNEVITIKSVDTQIEVNSILNKSIKPDIIAVDLHNNVYNIEMQSKEHTDEEKRIRYYSSILDSNSLTSGADYNDLTNLYIIFITNYKKYKKTQPIYHVSSTITELNHEPYNDGRYIIYLNCKYKDTSSDIGKLIHDLTCTNPKDMYFDVIAKHVEYYKYGKKGNKTMCEIMDKLIADSNKENLNEIKKLKESLAEQLAFNDEKDKALSQKDAIISELKEEIYKLKH